MKLRYKNILLAILLVTFILFIPNKVTARVIFKNNASNGNEKTQGTSRSYMQIANSAEDFWNGSDTLWSYNGKIKMNSGIKDFCLNNENYKIKYPNPNNYTSYGNTIKNGDEVGSDYQNFVTRFGYIWCLSELTEDEQEKSKADEDTFLIMDCIDIGTDGAIYSLSTNVRDTSHKDVGNKIAYLVNFWQNKIASGTSEVNYRGTYKYYNYVFCTREYLWGYLYNSALIVNNGAWNSDNDKGDKVSRKNLRELFGTNKNEYRVSPKIRSDAEEFDPKKDTKGNVLYQYKSSSLGDEADGYNNVVQGDFKNNGNTETVKLKNSTYNPDDGHTYNTKISGYSLTIGNRAKSYKEYGVQIDFIMSGKYNNGTSFSNVTYNLKQASDNYYYLYSGSTIKGRFVVSTSTIYLTDSIDYINSIKIRQRYTQYNARIMALSGASDQTRAMAKAQSSTNERVLTLTNPISDANISMQKYIVKVNDNNLTSNNTSLTNRKNTYTSNGEANEGAKKVTAKSESSNMQSSKYKYNNTVNIEAGDKVTYRIHVYNNSTNRNVSDITLADRLPFYSSNDQIYSAVTVEKITQGTSTTNIKDSWTIYLKNENGKNYTWIKKENINLNAGSSTYFEVTLKFNVQVDGILTNSACISCSDNNTEYRTVDRDYVQMKKYEINLEKYVSKVTDKDGNNVVVYDDSEGTYKKRAGHRYNPYASTKVSNDSNVDKITYNTSKKNNPVELEPGDKVTFTIQLKNTGETDVYVKQILDEFINDNGVVLTYVSNSLNANITTGYTESSWGFKFADGKKIDRNLLTFNDKGIYVPANGTNSFTVTFRVDIESDKTNISQTLFNHACINLLKNKNNVTVKDGDAEGVNNNRDTDYLKTKTYAVSLEKCISKVNNVSVTDLKYDVNGDGVVDLNDVELINKYIAKQPVSLNGKGDINDDGTINMKDDLALRKIIREGKAEHDYDDDVNTNNYWKNNNVVTVKNGDTVTYTIKVKNDSEKTGVYINQITDTLDSKGFDNRTFNILSAKKYNKYGTELSNILSSVRDDTVDASNNVKTITIDCNNNTFLNSGDYISIIVSVKVIEPNISLRTLPNTAKISGMKNKNNVTVKDTTPNNNEDADYIKLDWTLPPPSDDTTSVTVTKEWIDDYNKYGVRPASVRVVLYKIVDGSKSSVGGAVTLLSPSGNKNTVSYTWTNLPKKENGKDIKYEVFEIRESGTLVQSGTKYNNNYRAYYVDNSDNTIFTIKNIYEGITDDKTSVTVTKEWQDEENKYRKRPASIEVQLYKTVDGSTSPVGSKISLPSPSGNNNAVSYTWTNLPKKENGKNIKYTVKEVSVPDGYTVSYSLDTFHIINKYGDKPEDAVISGIVWNDRVTNKTSDNYDGLYQKSDEQLLSGIKVLLYRNGVARPIAKTTTDSNGYYYFNNDSIDATVVTNSCERYIKAPIKSTTDNKWAETYYSYYVVFEYDGVTYTSTPDGKNCVDVNEYDNYKINSNAKEDGIIKDETRQQFNSRFNNINNGDCVKEINTDSYYKIEYSTKNDAEKVPQSNHIYNPRTMAIHSCTGLINFNKVKELTNNSDITTYEDKIKNVNLGLRGRDVFDLELTSDVVSTKVTVNGVDGTYNYGNKVTVRRNDLSSMYNVKEDMANVYGAGSQNIGEDYKQKVRKTDIDADQTGAGTTEGTKKYDSTGLGIKVTYRITVTNASQTDGTATKIINYYDNRYTFKGAYANKADAEAQRRELEHEEGTSGTGYKSVLVTTKGNNLTQGASMDIYLVYSLNSPTSTLSGLLSNEKLPTYNMAEIYEYKTQCGRNQTEYTRGLIDKDSAPGSVATEKVRLASGNSTDTTLGYYFKAQNLQNLKYEDDTYAAPTLIFVSDDSKRTITGTVFEDITKLTEENVRTGNGIKDGDDPGVSGATVELIEGNTTRYTVETNEKGEYTFSGFLPGNYTIKYTYGEKDKTFIITSPNTKSYNGEDFQSTNNTGNYGAAKLSDKQNYWYIDNETEKVSTATEDKDRRQHVSNYFIGDNSDEKITVLNNARDGNSADECKVTYGDDNSNEITANNVEENSYMFANTKNMTFEVEKVEDSDGKQHNSFANYKVEGMNFGIAEVPVTEINLQKSVKEFTIKDSTGSNTIAQLTKDDDGKWNTKGDVIPAGNILDVQIEDEKLQGAKLEVTYDIIANMRTEKNFNNSKAIKANITGIVDFIDNNLSYSDNLGENSRYWEVTQFDTTSNTFAAAQYMEGTVPRGTIDPDGTKHTTIVKAKEENPILLKEDGTARAPITLEKILSSVDSTIEDIITSTVDTYEYSNIVEITGLDYTNVNDGGNVLRDRIRTKDRYIILPGVQHDSATSEKITIHTPTGDNNINIIYYVIAAVSLVVIAAGVFGIKKFVLKNNK